MAIPGDATNREWRRCYAGRAGPSCVCPLVVTPSGSRFSARPEKGNRTPRSRIPAAEPARRAHEAATKKRTAPWKGVSVSCTKRYRDYSRRGSFILLRFSFPCLAYLRACFAHGTHKPSFFTAVALPWGTGRRGCGVVVWYQECVCGGGAETYEQVGYTNTISDKYAQPSLGAG